MKVALALDLGGTFVKAALVTEAGDVLHEERRPSGEARGPEEWLAAGMGAARALLAADVATPDALGISVPGAVDPAQCRLVDLVDRLQVGAGIDLADVFAPLGLPTAADNDARAALAAELRWGSHAGARSLVVFTLGTGLGGAAVVDGRVPAGDVAMGPQLGHVTVDIGGERCVCGNVGCAETLASATAIVRAARAAGLDVGSAEDVFVAERGGDSRARSAVDRAVQGLAAAVVTAIHAFQPEAVVLGGGVMRAAERILDPVRQEVGRRAWTTPRNRVAVERTALGVDTPMLGAAAIAFESMDR